MPLTGLHRVRYTVSFSGMASKRPKPPADDAPDSIDSFIRAAGALSEPAAGDALLLPLENGALLADRFLIERLADSGGMGAVYRAFDRTTGRHVAVKVMARQKESMEKRFLREAAVLAELAHPQIVPYVAHGLTPEGVPFLAMDWLEGEDVACRLSRAPLSIEESLRMVRNACLGLAFAHERGVIHRDIKPSNLFLVGCDPLEVKVIDFGVARLEASAAALTRSGTSLGTVGYMSPEQAADASDVDARADVYSLGCVLFECLTGRAPFVGGSAALVAKVLRQPAPRASDLRRELSDEIDALLRAVLAKSRDDRPADARELARRIEGIRSPVR
jgi:serine/threonine protein kinase